MRLFLHCIGYFSKLVILHLLSKLLTSVVITAIVSTRVDQNILLLTINCLWRYSVKTPLFKGDPWINFIESIILYCGYLAWHPVLRNLVKLLLILNLAIEVITDHVLILCVNNLAIYGVCTKSNLFTIVCIPIIWIPGSLHVLRYSDYVTIAVSWSFYWLNLPKLIFFFQNFVKLRNSWILFSIESCNRLTHWRTIIC